jgi:hypothetical protein
MVDRLDEERLEILRSWGIGLASDDREELRAAGKAITVLIEEIDRLQIDLWNARAVGHQQVEPIERVDQIEQIKPITQVEPIEQIEQIEPLIAVAQGNALRDRLARRRPQI